MRKKVAKTKTRPWDAAEHLITEGDMAAYLEGNWIGRRGSWGQKLKPEALDRALSIVVSEAEIDKALRKLRGKGRIRKGFP
jgi:hypothetical protein